jgi:aminoglycoside phosphotransferase
VDPDLPTLPKALELPRIGRLIEPEPPPVAVEVVRHAREGTCVLHYSSDDRHGRQTPGGQRVGGVYGKVYGESAAQTGDHVLGMLRELRSALDPTAVRLPEPLGYDRRTKMLATRALPGGPLLPARLAQAFTPDASTASHQEAADLLDLIRASGCVLATLHGTDVPSAPVHPLAAEVERVTDQLAVVEPVWPEQADRVRRLVTALVRHAAPAPRLVVCHGDFTPSQLLLVRGSGDTGRPDQVSLGGLVDLDTVCWADPALDLGRFLAHVDLLATKTGGQAAERCSAEVAGVLLGAYRERATGDGRDVRELGRRVAVFRGLSLARTALRSCRQLKDDRFSIAHSLLETAHTWTGKVDS